VATTYWKNSDVALYCGNSVKILPSLGKFDLCFLDPPFNVGQPYNDYNDNLDPRSFKLFIYNAVRAGWNACRGVMCLHGPDNLCEMYLEIAAKYRMKRIAWVNWHYRFGQCHRGNWIDARCHCLIYARDPDNHTWNPEEVLVESDRSSTYGDRRIHDTENGGMRLPGTIWGIPSDGPYWGRVPGNSKERRSKHPNQLPEVYLERLIRAYTNEGDRVLDPFCGSGTTAVVASALGRKCATIDISEESLKSAKERIKHGAIRIGDSHGTRQ